MKINIIVILFLSLFSLYSQADIGNDIVQEMKNKRPQNVLLERSDHKGVNPELGIVKKEHVFIKNNIRYTVDYIDWYDPDKSDELAIYYRVNGTNKQDRNSIILVNLKNKSVNYFLSTGGDNSSYIVYGPQFDVLAELIDNQKDSKFSLMNKDDALVEINKHLNIILNSYSV